MTTVILYQGKMYSDGRASKTFYNNKKQMNIRSIISENYKKIYRIKDSIISASGDVTFFHIYIKRSEISKLLTRLPMITIGNINSNIDNYSTSIVDYTKKRTVVLHLCHAVFKFFGLKVIWSFWEREIYFPSCNDFIVMGSGVDIAVRTMRSTKNPITAILVASMVDDATNRNIRIVSLD